MSRTKPRVAIVTSFPRAQRVEVYNQMARLDEVDFRVFYLQQMAHGRHWTYGPEIRHDAVFPRQIRLRGQLYLNPGFLARYLAYRPDLMIMTQYASPAMQLAMYADTLLRRPWVFWAEFPGVPFAENPILEHEGLRDRLRALAVVPLRRFPREVWGIGTRARDAYREIVDARIPVRNLPYFADLERFFAAADRREPADRVRFLFCGSLSMRKGADVVAEAVRVLHDEGWDFELHVAGKGPLQDRFDALPQAARERVTHYGFLQLDDVPDAYAGADVLLFPSRHDGWGMTLPEGLGAGMPVISTDQTGSAVDLIRDGENGARLPHLDVEGLAAAMRRYLEHPERVAIEGAAAQATARGSCTHTVGARAFLDAIHRVGEV